MPESSFLGGFSDDGAPPKTLSLPVSARAWMGDLADDSWTLRDGNGATLGTILGSYPAEIIERDLNEAPEMRARVKELEADTGTAEHLRELLGEHPEECIEDRVSDLAKAARANGFDPDRPEFGCEDLLAFLTLGQRYGPARRKRVAELEAQCDELRAALGSAGSALDSIASQAESAPSDQIHFDALGAFHAAEAALARAKEGKDAT